MEDDGLEQELGSWYALRLRHHRYLALGASLAVLGIGLVGIQESFLGGLSVLVGLGALVVSIHLYGRLGEER
jgi:drug/metabolite transporter (DMT)-like permease